MREALDSHVGSHDSWIQGILSCYSKVKVKVFGIKYNKSQTGESLLTKSVHGQWRYLLKNENVDQQGYTMHQIS